MVAEAKREGPVPLEAIAYFEAKRIEPDLDLSSSWAEEHDAAFTIAGILEVDLLSHVKQAVDRAITEGTTLAEFKKQVGPKLQASGWASPPGEKVPPYRLKLIYDTNLRQARAAGQWQRVQRTKAALPYLIFTNTVSLRPRPEHQALVGTILPADDPWWDLHYPPIGYSCKHGVRQISAREVESRGGISQIPEEAEVTWTLPDGRTKTLPESVHPSFDFIPGKGTNRQNALSDLLEQKRAEAQ
jgi:SPP1 gp7 family putative phage head morphogenesis protein